MRSYQSKYGHRIALLSLCSSVVFTSLAPVAYAAAVVSVDKVDEEEIIPDNTIVNGASHPKPFPIENIIINNPPIGKPPRNNNPPLPNAPPTGPAVKTDGLCPDRLGSLSAARTAPTQAIAGYAYFCVNKGATFMLNDTEHNEGCVVRSAGPFQIKFPANDRYANSNGFKQYIQALSAQCKALDSNGYAGLQALFYTPQEGEAPLQPLLCDSNRGGELCTPIR
jgi:hypothetical protein